MFPDETAMELHLAAWSYEFPTFEDAREFAFLNCPPMPGVTAVYNLLSGDLLTEFLGYEVIC
jgi:hypothetical protein